MEPMGKPTKTPETRDSKGQGVLVLLWGRRTQGHAVQAWLRLAREAPAQTKPTVTPQNLLFCRVPIKPIFGFIVYSKNLQKSGFC